MAAQDLLIRALISAAASAVSTTVIVRTAEGAPKRKRRRRRKGKGKTDAKSERARKKAREKKERELKARIENPGARARAELAHVPGPGMTSAELVDSVRTAGQNVWRRLAGEAPAPAEPPVDAGAPKREKSERKGRREVSTDGYGTLKEEVLFVAKEAVKDKIVEASGVGPAVEVIKETSEGIKRKSGELGQKIKEAVPEDLGERVEDAGRAIAEGGKRVGQAISEAIPDDMDELSEIGEKMDRGLRGIGRWVQGPGAPNYDGEQGPSRVHPVGAGDVVTARVGPTARRPWERKADPPSTTPRPDTPSAPAVTPAPSAPAASTTELRASSLDPPDLTVAPAAPEAAATPPVDAPESPQANVAPEAAVTPPVDAPERPQANVAPEVMPPPEPDA